MSYASLKENEHGIVAWFASNPVATGVLLLTFLVIGVITSRFISVEVFPEYNSRTIRIETPYLGATADAVEYEIVKPLEESLSAVPGVAHVFSHSRSEHAIVDVEMLRGVDLNGALSDIRDAITQTSFKSYVLTPEVYLLTPEKSVLTLVLKAPPSTSVGVLRDSSERLQGALLSLPEISDVVLLGIPERILKIEIDKMALRRHQMTLRDVSDAISDTFYTPSSGELRMESGRAFITPPNQTDFERFADVVVGGVRLEDIAEVSNGFSGDGVRTTLNGHPAVFLKLRGTSNRSLVESVDAVKENLSRHELPYGFELMIWNDPSRSISYGFQRIIQSGVFGIGLLMIALTLVFGERTAIRVILGVVAVFFGALGLFPVFGLSINIITLFSFFILIGIVVDDAIVVADSVSTQKALGRSAWIAGVSGVRRVLWPVVLGAITTTVAFAMLLPIDGAIGQMFWSLPVVAGLVLGVSLIEASLILPSHLARLGGRDSRILSGLRDRLKRTVGEPVMLRILRMIGWSIRRFVLFPSTCVALLVISILFLQFGVVTWNPSVGFVNEKTIHANLILPDSASVDSVVNAALQAVDTVKQVDQAYGGGIVDDVAVMIGHLLPMDSYRDAGVFVEHGNVASVVIKLNDQLDVTPESIRVAWGHLLSGLPSDVQVAMPTQQTQLSGAVSYVVLHEDEDVFHEVANWVRHELGEVPGVERVSDSLRFGGRSIDVLLNPSGKALGLSESDIALHLRDSVHGIRVDEVIHGRISISVVVSYPEHQRVQYAGLMNEWVGLPESGRQVVVSQVAELRAFDSRADRLRVDGYDAMTVDVRLDANESDVGDVLEQLNEDIFPLLRDAYPGLVIRSYGITRESERAINALWVVVPIGVMVIYFVLAAMLRSYVQPILVLCCVPIAFVGAVFGHWVLGYQMTVVSVFGFIAASGVVLNDALLLMHRYNGVRDEVKGLPEVAAVSAATRQRARPILLTTMTTLAGLLPILLGGGAQEMAFLIPPVVSLCFGLLFACIGLPMLLPSALMFTEMVRNKLKISQGPDIN